MRGREGPRPGVARRRGGKGRRPGPARRDGGACARPRLGLPPGSRSVPVPGPGCRLSGGGEGRGKEGKEGTEVLDGSRAEGAAARVSRGWCLRQGRPLAAAL